MELKFNIFEIIMLIMISFSYLGDIFIKYSTIFDILLSLITITFYFYWIYTNGIKLNMKTILIKYLVLLLIVITLKFNLVSLILIIILLMIMRDNREINIILYIKISLLFFCTIIFCYFIFDFNKGYDTSIWRISTNEVVYRHSIGFIHPNQAMFKWLGIALALLTLINNKNIYKIILIVLLSTLLIYSYTQSRTVTFVIIGLTIILFIFKSGLNIKISKKTQMILALMPLILLAISLLSMYLSSYSYIDNFFSGRFTLYKHYFTEVGLNLWGSTSIEKDAMLDNSYLHMLLSKGVFFTTLYLFIIYNTIRKARCLTRLDFIIICSYFIAALMETVLFKFELILLLYIILFRAKDNHI